MKKRNTELNQYVSAWLENYRNKKAYSMEQMSERLLEDSRSYYDQEKGKIGFSGNTVCRMLAYLSDAEVLDFIEGLRKIVWMEEFQDEEKRV